MGVDLDVWIEKVRRCDHLAEDELKGLCEYVRSARACCWLSAAACRRGGRWRVWRASGSATRTD